MTSATSTCDRGGTRRERDALGELTLPADCPWGIHTERTRGNFALAGRGVHTALWRAYGAVKRACVRVNAALGAFDERCAAAVERAAEELEAGDLDHGNVTDALQGGAGTATNMNVNEVLANRALQHLGRAPGDYAACDPFAVVNRHQSTNDTYPTALRIAALRGCATLETAVVALLDALQERERALAAVPVCGRTQLQDALPMTLGRVIGSWADAIARDRWRIQKAVERLRVVNLGGTAVGTGRGAPRRYIFRVVEELAALTGLPLARAENLVDATGNQDQLLEALGMLVPLATTLGKLGKDLRLYASPGFAELTLPTLQAGSSQMPGKVNPVMPEAVQQVAVRVCAAQQACNAAIMAGDLQLSQFLPLVADEFLTALDLLARACRTLGERCIAGLTADPACGATALAGSAACATLLAGRIGYPAAATLARDAAEAGVGVGDLAIARGLITAATWDALLAPAALDRLGDPDAGEEGR